MRLAALVSSAFTAVAAYAEVVSPAHDKFYFEPAGLAAMIPGDIIGVRSVPHALQLDNVQTAYQIAYRTTDGQGNATTTVTTLIIPHKSNGHMIDYFVPEDATSLDCAPSYRL